MKYNSILLALAFLSTFNSQLSTAHAQGTAFTYQGRLNDGGNPASGKYDFRFKLYADPAGASQIGASFLTNAVPVTNGLFLTAIDFGSGLFNGSNYWLELDVKTNGAGSYAVLTPLQSVLPTPYAVFANTASNLSGTLPSGALAGTYNNAVAFNNAANNFSGNGGGLTGLNATNLAGTVADARLSANVALLNASPQTFNGANNFNNPGNSFNGSHAGNGTGLTNVTAVSFGGLNSSDFWKLSGNNVAAGQFIGSTNNQPLELWVNGQRGMRLESTAADANHSNIVNVVNGSRANFAALGVYGATISGGGAGRFDGVSSVNGVTGDFGTVGGGLGNTSGNYATVGGGYHNSSSGPGAFLGGGGFDGVLFAANNATGGGAVIGGGVANISSGTDATVGGGGFNTSSGIGAFVGGGGYDGSTPGPNVASGMLSVIGGGYRNQTTDLYATVPGGRDNIAGGQFSFAAGRSAQATNDGSFVWADSQNSVFGSTRTNQFNVRANGGVRFVTSGAGLTLDGQNVLTGSNGGGLTNLSAPQLTGTVADARLSANVALLNAGQAFTGTNTFNSVVNFPSTNIFFGAITRQMLNLFQNVYGIGVQSFTTYFRSGGGFAWYNGGVHNDSQNNSGGGTTLMTLDSSGNLNANGFIGGTLRVGTAGTTLSVIEAGQSAMSSGSFTVQTNFTVAFPQSFNSVPRVLATVCNDPGFPNVNDTFVTSIRNTTTTNFSVNIVRVDVATGWSQALRINWQAWQ